MDVRSVRWGRLALAAAVVMVGMTLLAPSAALAKVKVATRFVVASQAVADWSTGTTVTSPVLAVKLQKKSGSKWVSLRGAIKAYYWNAITSSWMQVGSLTGSNVTLTMVIRGRYKLTYAGSSTTKSTYSYTKRIDLIGETIGPVSVTFSDIDPTWAGVSVSYDVSWNTEAFPIYTVDKHLEFGYEGAFRNNSDTDPLYSGTVDFYQELWEPGTVTVTYRVRKADIPDASTLNTEAWFSSHDDYVRVNAYTGVEQTAHPF
jgi:hypothetical protein